MKKILFVINTLGRAGAEVALLGLLQKLKGKGCQVSLYVLLNQGEMIGEIPDWVRVLNPAVSPESVLSQRGRRQLAKMAATAFFRNGGWLRKAGCVAGNLVDMVKRGRLQTDKLLWRVVSDGAPRFEEHFDLAVAWLEGGSAYYVADWVRADKKAAFVHINYDKAGYTRRMDRDCWGRFDRIFAISGKVGERFAAIYPEYAEKLSVFPNILDPEYIRRRSREPGGFGDGYSGTRILTVGRLAYQKGHDIAIEAMKLLKDAGCHARWYVLGEGDQRGQLEKRIASLGLEEDFVLLGAVENPYPYYVQADLYVHASRFEGESIAIREAQILGRAVIASDCCCGGKTVEDGKYGISCELTPKGVADSVLALLADEDRRTELGRRAAEKELPEGQERLLLELLA